MQGEYTQQELERLAFAWLRRKKLEARLIATEVWAPLSKEKKSDERISPEEMIALLETL